MLDVTFKKGPVVLAVWVILIGLALTFPVSASAGDIDNEGPAFKSAAQVAHAENLAQKAAGEPAAEVMAALKAQNRAEKALAGANKTGDPEAMAAAQEAHHAAVAAAQAAMAEVCGVTPGDIAAMRDDGMGWGEIANTLGVHPGSLGLGHSKANLSPHHLEMSEATARDVKGGKSTMHGVHSGNLSGSKAMGLDHAAQSHDGGMSGEHGSGMGGNSDGHGGGGSNGGHDGGSSGGGGSGGSHDGGGSGGGHDGGGSGGGHM